MKLTSEQAFGIMDGAYNGHLEEHGKAPGSAEVSLELFDASMGIYDTGAVAIAINPHPALRELVFYLGIPWMLNRNLKGAVAITRE